MKEQEKQLGENMVTSLFNIHDILAKKILKAIGWQEINGEITAPGLESEAIEIYDDKINKVGKQLNKYYLLRGLCHLEQGYFYDALNDFEAAERLGRIHNIESSWHSFFMGLAKYGMQDYQQAIYDLENYFYYNEDSIDLNQILADLHLMEITEKVKKADKFKALKHLSFLLENDPDSEILYNKVKGLIDEVENFDLVKKYSEIDGHEHLLGPENRESLKNWEIAIGIIWNIDQKKNS